MEKPASFTLRRFLQTTSFQREQNTYSANLSDTSADESLPIKQYYSSRERKRRKTNFNSSDEDFPCVKSIKTPLTKDRFDENPAKSSESSDGELNRNRKYKATYTHTGKDKYKPSSGRSGRGSPKSVVASKRPRTEIYKNPGKNQGTKRLDDFLEQNLQHVDKNRLFKDLNIPKKYCKSKADSENSRGKSDMQDSNAPSPDSTMSLSDFSKKCMPEQENVSTSVSTISDDGKRTHNTNLKVASTTMGVKPGLSCNKASKTSKLDEFLEAFSPKNKVEREPNIRDSRNVSSSFGSSEESEVKESASKLVISKAERKQFPLKVEGSQKTMFRFFKKSKKYDKSSIGTDGCRKRHQETPVFMNKENRKVWRKEKGTIKQKRKQLFTDTIESILEERKRRMERLKGVTEEKQRQLVRKRSRSDSSEDTITRKYYSRKPIMGIKTKQTDYASEKSPNRDHMSSLLQSASKILIDPKSGRKIREERKKDFDSFKLNMMGAKSRFPLRKPLEEFNRGQNQNCFTENDFFSQELQENIDDNIWDAPHASSLQQFETNKSTDENRTFLRKSSSESNLNQNQHKNKPFPKLTFRKEADSPKNTLRFSSIENIRESGLENYSLKYFNLKGTEACHKDDGGRHEISKEIEKDHMSNITGNIFAQDTKTGSSAQSMVKACAAPATKSQKNLLSSEGFHESMSAENVIVENHEISTSSNKEKLTLKGSSSNIYEVKSKTEKVLGRENTSKTFIDAIAPSLDKKTSKDSLSDPLSLESQSVIFSPNEITCQYSRLPVQGRVEKPSDGSQNISKQKKEKFDSQALKDLCKILERNKWQQNFSVPNSTEKCSNESAVIDRSTEHETSQDNFPKLRTSEPLFSQASSGTIRKQCDDANNSELQKASISSIVSQNIIDDSDDNHQQHTETNEYTAYLLTGERDTQDNFTQTRSFTQQESSPKKKTCVKRRRIKRKCYNITEDCILFGDNLLKELLEEKPQIVEAYKKNKAKMKTDEEEDDVLAKTYIKRYKKGETNIFKIKRRLKVKHDDIYRAPEDHIIDRFTERLRNDFKDKSSSEREDDDSVSTPSSYLTVSDGTKSEALSTGSTKLPKHQRLLREGVNKLSKNRDLLFSRYSDSAPKDFDSTNTLNRIYEIILEVLDDYEHEREPCLKFPKNILRNYAFRDDRYQMAQMIDYTSVMYKWNHVKNRFNLLLLILNKIRLLLETGTKLTKRELYYQLKTMISYQYTTDTAIRDISKILNVGIWALNLTAQKGLVYGNLKLVMSNGETINCNVAGTSVPKDVMDICEIQSDAYFILVVEKESVFQKLLEEDLPKRLTRPFIMITGKGFPDLTTQLFLKKLWMVMTIPVFILVDADPDGIAIMLNYRFGSMANAHVSEYLAIPKARWIGVFPSEINKLSLSFEILTKREIVRTRQLLQLQCVQQNEKIKEQLQKLLDTETKAGIESVMKTDTYLSHRYLSTKFHVNDLI